MTCYNCGAPVTQGKKFCSKCAAPLACKQCGGELKAGKKFCSLCGTPISGAVIPVPQTQPSASEPVPAPEAPTPPPPPVQAPPPVQTPPPIPTPPAPSEQKLPATEKSAINKKAILIICLVVVVIIAAIYFLSQSSLFDQEKPVDPESPLVKQDNKPVTTPEPLEPSTTPVPVEPGTTPGQTDPEEDSGLGDEGVLAMIIDSFSDIDYVMDTLRSTNAMSDFYDFGFKEDRDELRRARNRGVDTDIVLSARLSSDVYHNLNRRILVIMTGGAEGDRRIQVVYSLDNLSLSPEYVIKAFNYIDEHVAKYPFYVVNAGRNFESEGEILNALRNGTDFQFSIWRERDEEVFTVVGYRIDTVAIRIDEGELCLIFQIFDYDPYMESN